MFLIETHDFETNLLTRLIQCVTWVQCSFQKKVKGKAEYLSLGALMCNMQLWRQIELHVHFAQQAPHAKE